MPVMTLRTVTLDAPCRWILIPQSLHELHREGGAKRGATLVAVDQGVRIDGVNVQLQQPFGRRRDGAAPPGQASCAPPHRPPARRLASLPSG
jgi:hypothetical protein